MTYVARDNSFALFGGVPPGAMETTSENNIIVQPYARGQLLWLKNPVTNKYITVQNGDVYVMAEADGNDTEMLVVGFSSHNTAKQSCLVHFWVEASRTFVRASTSSFMKHLKGEDNFYKKFDETQVSKMSFSITADDMLTYYSQTESVLTAESAVFKMTRSQRIKEANDKIKAAQKLANVEAARIKREEEAKQARIKEEEKKEKRMKLNFEKELKKKQKEHEAQIQALRKELDTSNKKATAAAVAAAAGAVANNQVASSSSFVKRNVGVIEDEKQESSNTLQSSASSSSSTKRKVVASTRSSKKRDSDKNDDSSTTTNTNKKNTINENVERGRGGEQEQQDERMMHGVKHKNSHGGGPHDYPHYSYSYPPGQYDPYQQSYPPPPHYFHHHYQQQPPLPSSSSSHQHLDSSFPPPSSSYHHTYARHHQEEHPPPPHHHSSQHCSSSKPPPTKKLKTPIDTRRQEQSASESDEEEELFNSPASSSANLYAFRKLREEKKIEKKLEELDEYKFKAYYAEGKRKKKK